MAEANPTEFPTEFQTAIFDWLDRTGMSQKEASDLVGVSQGAFNRWLQQDKRYRTRPEPETLEKLAPHIRIAYEELMRMTGRRVSQPATTSMIPPELQAAFQHMTQAWPETPPERRSWGLEVMRTMFPLHKRTRKPRGGHVPDEPDEPLGGLLTHSSLVLSLARTL